MAKRIRGSAVDRAFEIWASLTEHDRAEFDARVRGFHRALRVEVAPQPRVGRPLGSRNKPNGAVRIGSNATGADACVKEGVLPL